VRRCLVHRIPGGAALTGLLSAKQAESAAGASQAGKMVKVLLHG
jgi:hypothetical protein